MGSGTVEIANYVKPTVPQGEDDNDKHDNSQQQQKPQKDTNEEAIPAPKSLMTINAKIHYNKGSNYNPPVSAFWSHVKCDAEQCSLAFNEQYGNHNGTFSYQVQIDGSCRELKGSYKWSANQATGTVEISIVNEALPAKNKKEEIEARKAKRQSEFEQEQHNNKVTLIEQQDNKNKHKYCLVQ